MARAAEPRRARAHRARSRAHRPLDPRVPVADHRAGQLASRTRPTTRPRSRRCSCSPTSSSGCSATAAWTACVARTTRVLDHLYGWAEASPFATPFVADPAKRSLVVGTIDFDDDGRRRRGRRDAARQRHRRHRALPQARPQPAAHRMFPAIDPDDVRALTACIDWVVEQHRHDRASSSPRRSATRGIELLREHFDVDIGVRLDGSTSTARIGDYDGILIRSATKLDADLHRPRRPTCGPSAAPASASTTSTSRPRPSAGSSSPTRRSPTSSPPPSTRWRCCSRWPATSRRRTRR